MSQSHQTRQRRSTARNRNYGRIIIMLLIISGVASALSIINFFIIIYLLIN